MDAIARRSGNRVAPGHGHGHDVRFRKEFFALARFIGYDSAVSLERQDGGRGAAIKGMKTSPTTRKPTLPRDL